MVSVSFIPGGKIMNALAALLFHLVNLQIMVKKNANNMIWHL